MSDDAEPIDTRFQDRINTFCKEQYNKTCERFRTYTDGEVYGIVGTIRIPYSTVVRFETYWQQYKNSALSVNSIGDLVYGRMQRGKFIAVK